MTTTITILTIGLSTFFVAAWRSFRRHGAVPVIDPDRKERRLVGALRRHPRLAAFVNSRLDAKTAGGLLLTVSLALIFGLSLFAGWVFDSLDDTSGFARFDESLAEWGAAHATETSTSWLNLLTDLGGTSVIVVVTIAVGLYGWVRFRSIHVAMFVLAVTLSQTVVNNGLKWMIDRERPAIDQLAPWAGSSFPSGHSAAAAATYAGAALVLGLAASPHFRAALAAAAIAIAVAVGGDAGLVGRALAHRCSCRSGRRLGLLRRLRCCVQWAPDAVRHGCCCRC